MQLFAAICSYMQLNAACPTRCEGSMVNEIHSVLCQSFSAGFSRILIRYAHLRNFTRPCQPSVGGGFRCSAHPAGPTELRFFGLGFWDPWYRLVGCLVVGWLVGWLLVCRLVVDGLWLVVGGWWVVLGGWWVGLGLSSCCELLGTTKFWVTKLLPTTWNHFFGRKEKVVGSWWWHVVALLGGI